MNDDIVKLSYKILSVSSEDSTEGSANELNEEMSQGKGWVSSRFPKYPQLLYIQFKYPVQLKQMKIVIHETKIPSRIDFYSYMPSTQIEYLDEDYQNHPYSNFGFIKLNSNEQTNYSLRESKKINVDINAYCLKLLVYKNHLNKFNPFQQSSIISIEFYGSILKGGIDNQYKALNTNDLNEEEKDITDEMLENICGEKIRMIQEKINKASSSENFEECKIQKNNLTNVREAGKIIYQKEKEKKQYVLNEDFDNAIKLRKEIILLKEKLNKIGAVQTKIDNNNNNNAAENNDNTNINNNNTANNNNITNNNNTNNINNKVAKTKKNSIIEENIKEEINESNDSDIIEEKINDQHSRRDSHNISTISGILTSQQVNKLNKYKIKLTEEDFKQYDDIIPPAIQKKMQRLNSLNNQNININNLSNSNNSLYDFSFNLKDQSFHSNHSDNSNNDNNINNINDSPLNQEDDLDFDHSLEQKYSFLEPHLDKEGIIKLFSKKITLKKEGFELLMSKLTDIFISNEQSKYNQIVQGFRDLISLFIEEKHPITIFNTFNLIHDICDIINLNKNIDVNLKKLFNERIYRAILSKLSDNNDRIRKKSMELFLYLLRQPKLNYNDLIQRLLGSDLLIFDNSKLNNANLNISVKTILTKLSIIKDQFDLIKKNSSDISKEDFPINLVNKYLVNTVVHSNEKIRDLSRKLIVKYVELFGIKSIYNLLLRIDIRELNILRDKIPDLQKYFPKEVEEENVEQPDEIITNNPIQSNRSAKDINKININNAKSKSKSRSKEKKKSTVVVLKNPVKLIQKKDKSDRCTYCNVFIGNKDLMNKHKEENCPLFTRCKKCDTNLEVKRLNKHLMQECKFKANFKLCKRCKEPVELEAYDLHIKENRCNPAKNVNSSNRCPLCHKDIPPTDRGFYSHLAKAGCECQTRKIKNI